MDRSERPGEDRLRGDRVLPSIAEVLAMPALAEGRPEVLTGAELLDRPIRWVHVSEGAEIGRFLNGGEMLLTTGSSWPRTPEGLARFVAEVAEAGLTALVIELGRLIRVVPDVLVEECAAHGLVLVALHREVRFIAVTEAVHRRIMVGQNDALRARQELHALFSGLILHGAPADHIVQELARLLDAPVVLESLGHEAILSAGIGSGAIELLRDWETRSRRADDQADGWTVVPVEARGIRWGALVALPGPPHPAGRRTVLEQGAVALALGRLVDGGVDDWARISGQRLVDALLEGRFSSIRQFAVRLRAAGLPIGGRRLHGLAIGGLGAAAAAAMDDGARRLGGRAVAGLIDGSLVALVSLPPERRLDDAAVAVLLAPGAAQEGVTTARLSVAIGAAAEDVDGLLQSVRQASELVGPRGIQRTEARPLAGLVATLRDDRRFQAHTERMLAPLIEHDLRHGGDLLLVLRALLSHPGNRTAAASASHLSRSVFYQRLALIAELLDVDLDDGEALAALHLALLARRS